MLSKVAELDHLFANFDRKLRHAYLPHGVICLRPEDQGNKQIKLSGFIVPPHFIPREYKICLNGKPLTFQSSSIPDRRTQILMPPQPMDFGFEALLDDVDIHAIEAPMEISAISADGVHEFPWYMRSWLAPSWGPLPDPVNMNRVGIHDADVVLSLMDGASFHHKLRRLTELYMNRPMLELERILDWGCGYGRLIRFFPPEHRHKVTGADIDPVNIAWAQKHQPQFTFQCLELQPPTPFPDATFDLIYGGSVFSHLDEPDQFAWLAELMRITKPGGIVAVTVHSRVTWAINGTHNTDELVDVVMRGFKTTGVANPDVLDVAGDFYTDVFQNYDYILNTWSPYFEVVDILDSYYYYQALIVLRRRKD